MIVIKRDGSFADFNLDKIKNAICKAMYATESRTNEKLAEQIAYEIRKKFRKEQREIDISEIENEVYERLIKHGKMNVAKAYEGYRAVREHQRMHNTIDQKIIGVVEGNDENIKDNSNKNTALISTMRDLVAEEVSKDYALRNMLPPDIAQAHNEGIIYVHDLGHYLNPSTNCCLINLKDMLDNGTVINGKMITTPKSLKTACTVATQIIAQVASGQFGFPI